MILDQESRMNNILAVWSVSDPMVKEFSSFLQVPSYNPSPDS